MKKLTYNDEDYFYEIDKDYSITYIYSSKIYDIVYSRKYVIFGPKKEIKNYKLLYKLHIDIENPKYDKDFIKSQLFIAYKWINREKEIDNGEII